jgi:hypothetical protein
MCARDGPNPMRRRAEPSGAEPSGVEACSGRGARGKPEVAPRLLAAPGATDGPFFSHLKQLGANGGRRLSRTDADGAYPAATWLFALGSITRQQASVERDWECATPPSSTTSERPSRQRASAKNWRSLGTPNNPRATPSVMSSPSVSFGGRPGPRRCGAEEVIDLHIQCDNEASRASGAKAFKVDVAIATPPFGAPSPPYLGSSCSPPDRRTFGSS